MLELYFLIYLIPKTMTRLARERNQSALKWSLFGIGAWLGAELLIAFAAGFIYEAGKLFWGWPEKEPAILVFLTYIAALGAAIGSVTLVRRSLYSKSARESFMSPPPPPHF